MYLFLNGNAQVLSVSYLQDPNSLPNKTWRFINKPETLYQTVPFPKTLYASLVSILLTRSKFFTQQDLKVYQQDRDILPDSTTPKNVIRKSCQYLTYKIQILYPARPEGLSTSLKHFTRQYHSQKRYTQVL